MPALVMVDGEVLVSGFALTRADRREIVAAGRHAAVELARRAGL